jgi:hypothetical protein
VAVELYVAVEVPRREEPDRVAAVMKAGALATSRSRRSVLEQRVREVHEREAAFAVGAKLAVRSTGSGG